MDFHRQQPTSFLRFEYNLISQFRYNLETIILEYLKREKAELLDTIVSFETESTTFVAYANTEENQHKLAVLIQQLCTNKKTFKKVVKDSLEDIRTKYSP
jgi:hypothetical protein